MLSRRLWFAIASAVLLAACGSNKPSAPPKEYKLTGEVMRIEPQLRTAAIKHEKIEGWMEAMTMEFPVKDPAEFAKLTVGDRVDATLHVDDLEYYLAKIQVTAKAPAK